MDVAVDGRVLYRGARVADAFARSNPVTQRLVRLQADGHTLTLAAAQMGAGGGREGIAQARLALGATQGKGCVAVDGRCVAVDGRTLLRVAKAFRRESVRLSFLEGWVKIQAADVELGLRSASDEPLKRIPGRFDRSVSLCRDSLRSAVKAVAPAVSTDHWRGRLCQVYLDSEKGRLRLVATDGHRLHVAEGGASWAGPGRMIPLDALRAALHLDSHLELRQGEGVTGFVGHLGTITIRRFEMEYPNYRNVLRIASEKCVNRVVLRRSQLIRAASLLVASTTRRRAGVLLETASDGAFLCHREAEEARGLVRLGWDVRAGSPPDIGVNARFLRDAAVALRSREIELLVGNESTTTRVPELVDPIWLQAPDDSTRFCVIMPMRI